MMTETELRETEFKEQFESYKNGNISDFKKWLGNMFGSDVLLFIKWLQSEGLKL